jgi:hypothetical protein
VIGEPHPAWYLVQLFEWASGEPSVQDYFRENQIEP